MTRERALELFLWGPCYARPRPRNGTEYRAAIDFIDTHRNDFTYEELTWLRT